MARGGAGVTNEQLGLDGVYIRGIGQAGDGGIHAATRKYDCVEALHVYHVR